MNLWLKQKEYVDKSDSFVVQNMYLLAYPIKHFFVMGKDDQFVFGIAVEECAHMF